MRRRKPAAAAGISGVAAVRQSLQNAPRAAWANIA